jgi:hypothetical protein
MVLNSGNIHIVHVYIMYISLKWTHKHNLLFHGLLCSVSNLCLVNEQTIILSILHLAGVIIVHGYYSIDLEK